MDNATFETYLKERYNPQMDYYDSASKKFQKKYKIFQWILIILSAITPVIAALNGYGNDHDKKLSQFSSLFVVVISSIVAILTTGLKTFNYQELWITYRTTHEKLKPELYYYNFNVGEYGKSGVDKESLFVSRVESLLSAEHSVWPPAKKLTDAENEKENGTSNNDDEPKNTS
jgi:hypothetical protein